MTAKEILDYVLRDLTSPEGGFYSAEDADSEGEEGKFYLWTMDEIKQALPNDLADFAIRIFGITSKGNFSESFKKTEAKNILHLAIPLEQIASQNGLKVDEVIEKLGKIVNLLNTKRNERVHPFRDDKILVDWNGLTIAALAKAYAVFNESKYLTAAEKAMNFLLKGMRTTGGKLFHRYAKDEAAISGFLDDYACLIFGLIQLYEASFKDQYLQSALNLARIMINDFWDDENGGFFLTSQTIEQKIPRTKQTYDGAAPSGNSVALLDLLMLSRLSGDIIFEQYANKLLAAFTDDLKGYPIGHSFMLIGLDFALAQSQNVNIAGEINREDTLEMVKELRKTYRPNLIVNLWTSQRNRTNETGINYAMINEKSTAYVCKNKACMPPTNNIDEMLKLLSE